MHDGVIWLQLLESFSLHLKDSPHVPPLQAIVVPVQPWEYSDCTTLYSVPLPSFFINYVVPVVSISSSPSVILKHWSFKIILVVIGYPVPDYQISGRSQKAQKSKQSKNTGADRIHGMDFISLASISRREIWVRFLLHFTGWFDFMVFCFIFVELHQNFPTTQSKVVSYRAVASEVHTLVCRLMNLTHTRYQTKQSFTEDSWRVI